MKLQIIIVSFLLSSVCFAQFTAPHADSTFRFIKDSGAFYYSQHEVIAIANGIKKLKSKIGLYDTLVSQLKLQQTNLSVLLGDKSRIIGLKDQQLANYAKEGDEYKQIIENLTPKWYDNKLLWFGIGFVLGVLLALKL